MIELTVGNIDLKDYITKIRFDSSPDTRKSGEGFINYDGTDIYGEEGKTFRNTIQATAEGVPDAVAAGLDTVLHSERFEVTYTSPTHSSGNFECTSYSAEPDEGSHEDGSSPDWNITFTIESASPESSSGSGL